MHEKTPIFRSLAMIEERIQEKLTVEALAEGVHFSKYHYQRMFREAVGDSVMGYVTRRKLALAAGELAGTDSTVLEIALKYGYDSHEGFTRSFKAYLGVTPTEYRKHHLSIGSRTIGKERTSMMYSKATDEIIRELNGLIVEAMDTAAEARKYGGKTGERTAGAEKGSGETEGKAAYAQFWEFSAAKAEKIAGRIKATLESVAAIAQSPDEISARFLIIKAVEDVAYEASVTAFQTGLTIARALPEHREAFQPLCDRYDALARHARIGAGKIVDFFHELSALIFRDMRKNGQQKIDDCVEAGRAAAQRLSDPTLPYIYIAEEILEIVEGLSATPLEAMNLSLLEDAAFHLEAIAFAAEVDIWRQPLHRQLFDGISDFRERMEEALEFFRRLSEDSARALTETGEPSAMGRPEEKMYRDLATQESILLFYLKGEIQKLGDRHLSEEQKSAFDAICGKMGEAIQLARGAADGAAIPGMEGTGNKTEKAEKAGRLLREACQEMLSESQRLGIYGGAVRYIAEEARAPLKYLPD